MFYDSLYHDSEKSSRLILGTLLSTLPSPHVLFLCAHADIVVLPVQRKVEVLETFKLHGF